MQIIYCILYHTGVIRESALCQLQIQVFWRNFVFFDQIDQRLQKIRIIQIHSGNIHGDHFGIPSVSQIILNKLAHLIPYIVIKPDNKSVTFKYRDKVPR